MQHVLGRPELWTESLFDYSAVVFDPAEPAKKVEPYHFDSRRGALARPIDAGFSLDPLDLVSVTFPAVEILCLVGLQRFRPRCMPQARFFEYFTWGIPLGADVAPAAVCGWLPGTQPRGFHFENGFRTDQRKHKAFMPATRLEGSSL
jgi:CRISPR-associated protein Csb3